MVGLVGLEPTLWGVYFIQNVPFCSVLNVYISRGTGIRTLTVNILSVLPRPIGLCLHKYTQVKHD